MLQIEEWFRRPQRKVDRREKQERPVSAVPRTEEKYVKTVRAEAEPVAVSETVRAEAEPASVRETGAQEAPRTPHVAESPAQSAFHAAQFAGAARQPISGMSQAATAPVAGAARGSSQTFAPQRTVSLPDSVSETDEIDQITEKIGLDVTDMIDLEREDFLLRQIDEFREKARQLQQLMATRKDEAKKLQSSLSEKEAKASELDELITVRQGEADKIMDNVSEKINAMSAGVRQEMSGLSDAVSRQVSGLTENLTHEINQSAESTRQAFETAAQNMIDQNTRSLEGLKEQLEQLGQLEQINELSTEMNSQITTLKTDIADKIHAEDVKCYRNIQASMDEQSKLLSDADEKTRQHVQEQMDSMQERITSQARLLKVALGFSVLNFLGIIGVLAYMIVLL